MRTYSTKCETTKQINKFLSRVGLQEFAFDVDYEFVTEFDFDEWVNTEETKGVALQVTTDLYVFVTKYTKKDIEILEKELE